jgi:hypothetical protein
LPQESIFQSRYNTPVSVTYEVTRSSPQSYSRELSLYLPLDGGADDASGSTVTQSVVASGLQYSTVVRVRGQSALIATSSASIVVTQGWSATEGASNAPQLVRTKHG